MKIIIIAGPKGAWKTTNLHDHYLKAVDEWSIYDGSQNPPRRIETSAHQPPETLMEDPAEYHTTPSPPTP